MSLSVVGVVAALLLSQQATVIENRSTNVRPTVGRGVGEARTERVCRMERIIGSNFSRRVCRTRALNAQARDDSQDGLRRLQGARMPDGQ